MSSIKKQLPIICIIAIGAVVRFYGIANIPPSLNWDEISHGYNAYSILHSGRDEWGEYMPIIFRAYGDYKLPVYIYLTAISEYFFGLTPFAIRLPSIIAGLVTIFYSYRLIKLIFGEKVATLTALLVAIEPWSLFLSRAALEGNLALTFIVSGIYYLFEGLKSPAKLTLSILLLGVSVWTYNSARVFVPMLLISFGVLFYREIVQSVKMDTRLSALTILIGLILFVPMGFQLLETSGSARYENIAIINDGAVAEIEAKRNETSLPSLPSRLIYNRPIYFLKAFSVNYIAHFLPNYLFISGASDYQFNVPDHGLLFIIDVLFFYLGGWLLFKDRKEYRTKLFILAWLLLGPVAGSLTRGAPHTLRNIVSLPIPMLLITLGITQLSQKKYFAIAYLFIISILFGNYIGNYSTSYRTNYSWSWQYGHEQMAALTNKYYDNYDKIVVTKKYGEPHEFLLFYGAKNNYQWYAQPEHYFNDPNLVRFNQSNWWWVDRFDKFYFVNDWEVPHEFGKQFVLESKSSFTCNNSDSKCLLVTSPGNVPEKWTKIESVDFLDGQTAFEFYEI